MRCAKSEEDAIEAIGALGKLLAMSVCSKLQNAVLQRGAAGTRNLRH